MKARFSYQRKVAFSTEVDYYWIECNIFFCSQILLSLSRNLHIVFIFENDSFDLCARVIILFLTKKSKFVEIFDSLVQCSTYQSGDAKNSRRITLKLLVNRALMLGKELLTLCSALNCVVWTAHYPDLFLVKILFC